MAKKGIEKNRKKAKSGTKDRTTEVGSARKNHTRSLCQGRPMRLSRRQIVDLNRKLQGIIDWMPIPMPEIKADIVRLCEQDSFFDCGVGRGIRPAHFIAGEL